MAYIARSNDLVDRQPVSDRAKQPSHLAKQIFVVC